MLFGKKGGACIKLFDRTFRSYFKRGRLWAIDRCLLDTESLLESKSLKKSFTAFKNMITYFPLVKQRKRSHSVWVSCGYREQYNIESSHSVWVSCGYREQYSIESFTFALGRKNLEHFNYN